MAALAAVALFIVTCVALGFRAHRHRASKRTSWQRPRQYAIPNAGRIGAVHLGALVTFAAGVAALGVTTLATPRVTRPAASGGGHDVVLPTLVTLSPASAHFTSPILGVTVDVCAASTPHATMTLNGSDVTSLFSGFDNTQGQGCGMIGTTWTGTVTLVSGANSFTTRGCDAGVQCQNKSATYYYDPPIPVPTTIVISPSSTTLLVNATGSLHATVYDQNGQPMSVASMTWASSNNAVASVQPSGSPPDATITGVSTGTATITATSGSASASTSVTVTAPTPVATSIVLSPSPMSLLTTTTGSMHATVYSQFGQAMSVATMNWTSSNSSVASASTFAGSPQDATITPSSAGTATITATTGSASASATVTVSTPVPPAPEVVAPSPITISAGGAGTLRFRLASSPWSQTASLSVTCSGLATCSVAPSVGLPAFTFIFVDVTVGASASQSGSFPVTLTATGPGGAASASTSVSVTAAGSIALTNTLGSTSYAQVGGTGSATYLLTNNTPGSISPSTSIAGCTGAIGTCTVDPFTAPGPGGSVAIVVRYSALSVTGGQPLTLTVAAGSLSAQATVTVVVTQPAQPSYSISVTGNPSTSSTAQGSPGSASYTVTNTSTNTTAPLSISFSVSGCSAAIAPCSTPAPISLAQNASQPVTVGYFGATAPAAAAVTLTANAPPAAPKQGTVNVTVTSLPLPGTQMHTALAGPFPGGAITRDACLTIAAGANAAYECGALRVAHALPTTTTYGKARTPVLLYNTNHAAPGTILAIDVDVNGTVLPTSIDVKVTLGGKPPVTRSYPWTPTSGVKQRIGFPIDAVAQTLTNGTNPVLLTASVEIKAMLNGAALNTDVRTAKIALVDRRFSPFGAGWWLDGLEQFVQDTVPTQKLWVGGDGSTRVYTQRGTSNTWLVTPAVSRPDTLEFVPSLSVWRRHLPNGAFVEFSNTGQHLATVDALGRRTTFTYMTAFGRTVLQSIQLPVQSGAIPTYTFAYGADNAGLPRLATVTAPPSGGARTVTVSAGAGPVTFIQDPDASRATFVSSGLTITKRITALGDTTSFAYDEAGQLRSAALDMRRTGGASAPPIVQSFCASESRSLTSCGGGIVNSPLPLTKTYTLLDGPRIDVQDTTVFVVNRFGAPDTVVNALGHRTRITRNAAFPLLADTVIAPSGLTIVATYTTRGLVATSTVLNPHGTGNAVTTYQWDDTLDVPVRIQAPAGVVETRLYNRAARTVTWAQTSGDTTRFTYYTGGLVNTAVRAANGASESFAYDTRGNLATRTAPLTGTTTITHDAAGRDSVVVVPAVVSTTTTSLMLYDLMGRDTLHRTTGGADNVTVQKRYGGEGNLLRVAQAGSSDPNGIGPVTHTFGYDAAGRQISDSLSGSDGPVRNTFDAAGNLIAGGRTLFGRTTTYDVLNRPTQSNGGYSSSTFTYDAFGRLATATNPFAQVGRAYDISGALIADTLRIATVGAQPNTTNDFSQHQYIITYSYDPSGRRLTMTQPAALGGGTTSYTYDDPKTGALALVTDPAGIKYRYHYDLLGRLDSLVRRSGLPDSVPETWTFDPESRMNTRRAVVGNDVLYAQGFLYDKRSRIVNANGDSIQYDLFGQTTYSKIAGQVERMSLDVLGNRVSKLSVLPHGSGGNDQYSYAPGTGRLRFVNRTGALLGDTTFYSMDWLGNTVAETHNVWGLDYSCGALATYTDDDFTSKWAKALVKIGGSQTLCGGIPKLKTTGSTSTYDDDNHLIRSAFQNDSVFGAQTLPPGVSVRYTASEEYRYDALGRRVWVRVLRDTACYVAQPSTGCRSSVTRMVWDGDQVAGELRTVATSPSTLQGDLDTDFGAFAGVVSYTHGGGVDHPLAVRKVGALTVLPLTDWHGPIGLGVCSSGSGPAARCAASSVLFPLRASGVFGAAMSSTSVGPPSWYGSLIDGMRDGSGKVYQRNRYLDPETGRFTQEDPIGLAGGMNLYGFAGGDPVNFSDPLGLCPESAGGDGKNESFSDCEAGTSGWYANRLATGEGNAALNTAGGLLTTCHESFACSAVIAMASLGASLVEGSVGTAATEVVVRGGESIAAANGRAAHKALAAKVVAKGGGWQSEQLLSGANGRSYRPDVITPNGHILELKPNTPSGHRRGAAQAATYLQQLGMVVRLIFY